MIALNAAAVTNVGKIRSNNEDNYFINGKYRKNTEIPNSEECDNERRRDYVFAVCDGMGGEARGEIASLIAVKALTKYADRKLKTSAAEYFEYANRLICEEIEKNNGVRMGSTIALVYIDEEDAFCYNIGDSRIYFYRDGELRLISKDHTQAQSLVDMGLLKKEEASLSRGKHCLTQHLGIFPDEIIVQPDFSGGIELKKNDVLILCSDGVTDMVSEGEIKEILAEDLSAEATAHRIVEKALLAGGKDNSTAIAVKIIGVGKKGFIKKIF